MVIYGKPLGTHVCDVYIAEGHTMIHIVIHVTMGCLLQTSKGLQKNYPLYRRMDLVQRHDPLLIQCGATSATFAPHGINNGPSTLTLLDIPADSVQSCT